MEVFIRINETKFYSIVIKILNCIKVHAYRSFCSITYLFILFLAFFFIINHLKILIEVEIPQRTCVNFNLTVLKFMFNLCRIDG